jgi:rSAM/selenodomain-associated transferase 1
MSLFLSTSSGVNGSTPGGRCALAIMLKAPEEGRVKTRLSPPLSARAAADLSRRMIRDTAENIAGVCERTPACGVAVYTPAGSEAVINALVPPEFGRLLQRGHGFGERLAHAVADLLAAGFGAVCLIDSDSPTLPSATLAAAVDELRASGDRLVIAGAEDGGYCLIGLNAWHPEVFEAIDWSTPQVRRQTIERAAAIRLGVSELPGWYDVDDQESLSRLRQELLTPASSGQAMGGYPAPHTRRFLAELAKESPGPLDLPW